MVAMSAMPAMAAPVVTGGLVNVTIVDAVDVNNNTVQLPIGVAANVCDVNAAVLVGEFQDTGDATCDATADAVANAPGARGQA
jgi:hypothetical protein